MRSRAHSAAAILPAPLPGHRPRPRAGSRRAPVGQAPARGRARHASPSDRRSAPTAGLAGRGGRPTVRWPSRRSPVVVWTAPLLVHLQHQPGPPDQPARSGTSPTGRSGWQPLVEAELGGVHVADAGQVALVEQRLADGSGAPESPGAGAPPRPRPSRGRAGRGRGARRPVLLARGAAARRCRGRSRPRPGRRCAGPPGPRGRAAASAGRGLVDLPAALHLQVGVQRPARRCPRSMRVSRCLPRETVWRTSAAGEVGGGERRHPEVGARSGRGRPAPGRGSRAVRQTVSPSGTAATLSRSPRGVATKPAACERRAQRASAPEPSSCSPSACSTVSRPSEPAPGRVGQRRPRPG